MRNVTVGFPLLSLLFSDDLPSQGVALMQSVAQMRISGPEGLAEPFTDEDTHLTAHANMTGTWASASASWSGEVEPTIENFAGLAPSPALEGRLEDLQDAAAGLEDELHADNHQAIVSDTVAHSSQQTALLTSTDSVESGGANAVQSSGSSLDKAEEQLVQVQEAKARAAQVRVAAVEERIARVTEAERLTEFEDAQALKDREAAEKHAKELTAIDAEAQAQAVEAMHRAQKTSVAMQQAWSKVHAADLRAAKAAAAKTQMARDVQAALDDGASSNASDATPLAPIVVTEAPNFNATIGTELCGHQSKLDCAFEIRVVTFGYKTSLVQGAIDWFGIVSFWILSMWCCIRRKPSAEQFWCCQLFCIGILGMVVLAIIKQA